jgi:SAM-dependent methyltransferase
MTNFQTKPWYLSILCCPDCKAPLDQDANRLCCSKCDLAYSSAHNSDFRPKKSRSTSLDLSVILDPQAKLAKIEIGRPEITYLGPRGIRDGAELLSVLQQSLPAPGCVLDLGCGPRDQATPISSLGHRYVGVDYSNPAADMLVDAHSLPFCSDSFDFVFSYAVLEHLHNPFLALHEISRVLKPGGVMCGTVSLGEPFHASFFHHSAWGLISVCTATNFDILRLWTCWDTLDGLASMGRYSRVVRLALKILGLVSSNMPLLSPRKMRWPKRDKALDELHRAAAIGFVIRKPATKASDLV